MKHYLYPFIFLLTFSLAPTHSAYTQNNQNSGFQKIKIPRSQRKSTASIARYLTKNVSGDSLKVVAIASWMVSRYRYNFKALKTGNWKRMSTDKLLKKRKALCGDFSDLFKEVCAEAGLSAETVIGYTKTWNYEPYDSLIRAEHAWNVVMVDGEWRPIDIAWSTGYVIQKKQWIRKKLYLWFSIPYNFKYKYIHQLNYNYMFTPPELFIQSHDPLQPYWQLLRNPVPIKAFEMDSTNEYLQDHNTAEDKIYNFNYYISSYRSLPEKDKHLKGAQQAFEYNKKNHRILGIGYYNYATVMENEIDPEIQEEKQIEQLDTCRLYYERSKVFYQEYLKDTNRELQRRRTRNKRFKDYLLKENKAYISQLKSNYKGHKREHYNTRVDINKKKGLKRRLERYITKYSKTSLNKVKRPLKENRIKIAKAKNYIAEINRLDSLLQFKNTISLKDLHQLDRQLNDSLDSLHTDLVNAYTITYGIAKYILPFRYYYTEYSRKFIDPVKDTLGTTIHYNEDLNSKHELVYDSLLSLKDSITHYYESYTDNYLLKLNDLKGLKRNSISDQNEDETYTNNLNDLITNYRTLISNYDSIISIDQEKLPEINDYLHPIKKSTRQLKKEIMLEYKRFRIHNRHYKHMHYFYKMQAYYLKKAATNRIRICKEEVNYLHKKIKERDAKLPKTSE